MLKKAGLMIVALLVLALAVMVIQERIWPPQEALANSSTLTPLYGENVYLNGKNINSDKTVRTEEGDVIRTEEDSWALVTFEDGSTMEMEPYTEIKIEVLTDIRISVGQKVGRTWSGVEDLSSDPINNFKITTPSAEVIVRGTLIDTLVEETGDSLVGVYKGMVEVTNDAGITRLTEAGMQSLIMMGEVPQVPQPIPLPQNRLEFTIDGPAWATVVDWPQQRSIGVAFPGIVTNQLPRSTTTGTQASPQFIAVPVSEEEGTKTYYVVLYGIGDEVNTVKIEGYTGGEKKFTILEQGMELQQYRKSETESKSVARLELSVDAYGNIVDGELGEFMLADEHPDFDLWSEGGPGCLEIKDWAMARAGELVAPQASFRASMRDGKISFANISTGDIVSYSWDFGDGSTSGEINPSHEYGEGEYTVSLTVSSPLGESDTARITIYVFIAPGD